jgi:WhiB family redox-sensing transcriptional regulator
MTIERTDWTLLAACRGMNTNAFFPELSVIDDRVLAACTVCPVREECLDHALTHHEDYGIWGGLTELQRDQVSKTKSRVRCPDCRSDWVTEEGHNEVCINCGLSWPI